MQYYNTIIRGGGGRTVTKLILIVSGLRVPHFVRCGLGMRGTLWSTNTGMPAGGVLRKYEESTP